MPTWPAKTNYATGDVLTAAQMQDIGNALNSVESAQYAAGKNKIINGDFNINQRGFTSTTTPNTYGFDRWFLGAGDGTVTYSTQNFTLGTAPVAGYEGKSFAQIVTTGQTLTLAQAILVQRIESVRTLAGQTATFSFWAKANTGTPKIALDVRQRFGTGGSPSSNVSTYGGQVTLSTSWARYSLTVSIPSLSGKTLGTNNDDALEINLWVSAGSDFNARTGSLGIQSNTFQIWGVQAESGSSATPFQTATGTLAGELAACQRYYFRWTGNASNQYATFANGVAASTTSVEALIIPPATMRTAPTAAEFSTLATFDGVNIAAITAVSIGTFGVTADRVRAAFTTTGATQYRPYFIIANNSTTGYLALTAEL